VRAFRHRKHVNAFEALIVGIVKFLVNRSDRYLTIDLDVNVMTGHLERRKREMTGRD
jgi:hypothetical protein